MKNLVKTNKLLWTIIGSLTLMVSGPVEAQAQEKLSARQIMDRVAENRKLDGSEALMTMEIYNAKGQKRVRKMAVVSKLYDDGKTEKKMSRFLSPPDVKGTGFMTFDYENKDDDMWLFMPALRKTRRIISSEKSKSFMGSEFAYSDINVANPDDFKYKILKEEKVGKADCWVIQAIPKTDDIAEEHGYSKQIAWVAKSDFVLRKGMFYDLDGELLKELIVHKVKLIDPVKKRYWGMKMEMINKQNGRRSIITAEKMELSKNVDDEYFTTRYLERF